MIFRTEIWEPSMFLLLGIIFFLDLLRRQSWKIYACVCVYMHTCTHAHTHISYLFLNLTVHVKSYTFILVVSIQPDNTDYFHIFLFSVFVTPFCSGKKPGFNMLSVYAYLLKSRVRRKQFQSCCSHTTVFLSS